MFHGERSEVAASVEPVDQSNGFTLRRHENVSSFELHRRSQFCLRLVLSLYLFIRSHVVGEKLGGESLR